MKNIEQPSGASFEQENGIEKIEQFLKDIATRYRGEGIPVGDDGRISMEAYQGLYPDVAKDMERNREWEKDWFAGLSEDEVREKRRHMDGEQLEMLAYAIFVKNLGEQFVVVRSSPHDDRKNKVDTIILDRTTGSLVCAFDEVGDASGPNYEKKQALVMDKNREGGASLKYGIGIQGEEGNEKIVASAANHLPLFYIALPPDRIKKGIKEFVSDPVKQSEFEERLFSYFLATIGAQINALELYRARLDPELKEKLDDFKDVIAAFNAKRAK